MQQAQTWHTAPPPSQDYIQSIHSEVMDAVTNLKERQQVDDAELDSCHMCSAGNVKWLAVSGMTAEDEW